MRHRLYRQTYPNVPQDLIDFALKRYPYGEILEDKWNHPPGVAVFDPDNASDPAYGNRLCPL